MANTQKYLNHLLQSIGITPACSEEERAAAEEIARIFSRHGFDPEIQEFTAPSSPKLVRAVFCLLLFISAVLMGVGGALGIAGVLVAIVCGLLFLLERLGFVNFPNLGSGGLSQNVIAYHKAEGPLASPRNRPVVVVAHYDSPRADFMAQAPFSTYRPILVKILPIAVLVPAIAAIIRIFPIPDAAKTVLWVVAIIASVVPLVSGVAILLNRYVLPYTSGSVCNKSSVAAMMGVMDAVSPYRGANEFPDDIPFDQYMEEQRRLYADYGMADDGAPVIERDQDYEEQPYQEQPRHMAPAEIEAPASDEHEDVLEGAAASMPAVQTYVDEEPDQTGATSSFEVISGDVQSDATGVIYGDEVEDSAQQAEPEEIPYVEEEEEDEEDEVPVNAAGCIRYGVDVLRSLGMVAESCAIEYEQGALPMPKPKAVLDMNKLRAAAGKAAPEASASVAPAAAPVSVEPEVPAAPAPQRVPAAPAPQTAQIKTPQVTQESPEVVPAAPEVHRAVDPTAVPAAPEPVSAPTAPKPEVPEPDYQDYVEQPAVQQPASDDASTVSMSLEEIREAAQTAQQYAAPIDVSAVERESEPLSEWSDDAADTQWDAQNAADAYGDDQEEYPNSVADPFAAAENFPLDFDEDEEYGYEGEEDEEGSDSFEEIELDDLDDTMIDVLVDPVAATYEVETEDGSFIEQPAEEPAVTDVEDDESDEEDVEDLDAFAMDAEFEQIDDEQFTEDEPAEEPEHIEKGYTAAFTIPEEDLAAIDEDGSDRTAQFTTDQIAAYQEQETAEDGLDEYVSEETYVEPEPEDTGVESLSYEEAEQEVTFEQEEAPAEVESFEEGDEPELDIDIDEPEIDEEYAYEDAGVTDEPGYLEPMDDEPANEGTVPEEQDLEPVQEDSVDSCQVQQTVTATEGDIYDAYEEWSIDDAEYDDSEPASPEVDGSAQDIFGDYSAYGPSDEYEPAGDAGVNESPEETVTMGALDEATIDSTYVMDADEYDDVDYFGDITEDGMDIMEAIYEELPDEEETEDASETVEVSDDAAEGALDGTMAFDAAVFANTERDGAYEQYEEAEPSDTDAVAADEPEASYVEDGVSEAAAEVATVEEESAVEPVPAPEDGGMSSAAEMADDYDPASDDLTLFQSILDNSYEGYGDVYADASAAAEAASQTEPVEADAMVENAPAEVPAVTVDEVQTVPEQIEDAAPVEDGPVAESILLDDVEVHSEADVIGSSVVDDQEEVAPVAYQVPKRSDIADFLPRTDDRPATPVNGGRTEGKAPLTGSTELFNMTSVVDQTAPMPSPDPTLPKPDETVDSLMAEIEAPRPARKQRSINLPDIAAAPRAQANSSLANRAALLDLPDPSTGDVDPFVNVGASEGSRFRSTSQFTVVNTGEHPAPVAPAAGTFETISAPKADAKKKKRRSLFGRKKKKDEDGSLSEWLGVDDNYDAKSSGRNIGSWDKFEGNDSWKGGAAGDGSMSEEELRQAVASLGDDELLGHDIWFVATGSSEQGNAGIREFLQTHRDKLRGVFLINLESIGSGRLAMLSTEGERRVLKGDKRIMGLISRVSADFHHEIGAVDMPFVDTDAHAAMEMSLRSVTIAGVEGQSFACSHSQEDIPVNVNTSNIALASDVVTEVIRRS